MELTFEQVKPLFSNCLSVTQAENGYMEISRFTEKQYAVYGKPFFGRAHCAPCACLDFWYDGKTIAFGFLPKYFTSRSFLSFDLYADGVLVHTLYTFRDGDGVTHFEYSFQEAKRRRIQIFFPFSVGVLFRCLTLDDGAHFAPVSAEGRKKFLILGDSITHGYDARYNSLSYACTVGRHFDAVVLNQAVGGYFFEEKSLDADLPFAPDVITVAYGTNDWGRNMKDEEKYKATAKAYIDKLCALYPNAKIFGILPIWRADMDKRPERMPFARVYEMLEECYAAHPEITVIDGRGAVPHISEAYTDGLHPNTTGQCLYAQYVIAALEAAGIRR